MDKEKIMHDEDTDTENSDTDFASDEDLSSQMSKDKSEEDESEDEDEDESEEDDSEGDDQDDPELLKKLLEDKDRELRRTKARLRKESEKRAAKKPQSNEEIEALKKDLQSAKLEARGYNQDEVEFIQKAAARLGVDALEAAKDEFVAEKINSMRTKRKTEEAIIAPGGKSSSGDKKTVQWYIDNDELPEDDEMLEKVVSKLRGRSH